ncbi:MAG: DNA-binding response regulator VicR [Candidatus Saccharibacteria bacterium]|nr:DNA-binding response regulator VicR [Candidatus Saccharibacteria bacterium]
MAEKSAQTIFIVEDDQDLNGAYHMILESSGYDVTVAFNGKEALEKLSSMVEPPRIIFLDLRMPVLDGIGFLKEYNAPAHPETTVVVFSNYDAQKEVDEAYELGASRYVLKARATPNELVRIVRDIMSD